MRSIVPLAGLPLIHACSGDEKRSIQMLSHPHTLMQLCDATTLQGIGDQYLAAHPDEKSASDIVDLLLADDMSDSVKVQEYIRRQIAEDFSKGDVIKADGWIVSVTEARQCALFSLSKNNHAY